MHRVLFLLAFFFNATYANVLHLDKNHITITPQFTGDNLNMYGIQPHGGSIIVILKGEKETYYIQKKEKKFGIWVKGEKKKFTDIYRYYDIFSQQSLEAINMPHILKPFEIGIENINTYNTTVQNAIDVFEYKNALFKNKAQNNLYKENYNSKITTPENLLYLQFKIPHNIPEGNYMATVYFIKEGQIQKIINMPIYISYSKLLKFLTNAVKHQKLLYLFLSITSSIGLALIAYIILGRKYIFFFQKIVQLVKNLLNKEKKPETTTFTTKAKRGRPRKITKES